MSSPATQADVLFLHGFGADRLSWLATTPRLTGVRAHTPDLPGHGEADMDPLFALRDGTPSSMTRTLARFVERDVGRPVHVVGHSLGGGLALLLADTHPELVCSVFLLAPVGLDAPAEEDFASAYVELEAEDVALAQLRKLVHRPEIFTLPSVQYSLAQLARPGARVALRSVARSFLAEQARFEAAARSVAASGLPRFVIWGEDDTVGPPDRAALGAFGPHLLLPDTGHLPHVEQAVEVNARLLEFIATA